MNVYKVVYIWKHVDNETSAGDVILVAAPSAGSAAETTETKLNEHTLNKAIVRSVENIGELRFIADA